MNESDKSTGAALFDQYHRLLTSHGMTPLAAIPAARAAAHLAIDFALAFTIEEIERR